MLCPKCETKTSVYNSRPTDKTIRRHRKCTSCDWRFATIEVLEVVEKKPVKKKDPIPQRGKKRVRKRVLQPRKPRFEELDFDSMTDEEIENALDNYR